MCIRLDAVFADASGDNDTEAPGCFKGGGGGGDDKSDVEALGCFKGGGEGPEDLKDGGG